MVFFFFFGVALQLVEMEIYMREEAGIELELIHQTITVGALALY